MFEYYWNEVVNSSHPKMGVALFGPTVSFFVTSTLIELLRE